MTLVAVFEPIPPAVLVFIDHYWVNAKNVRRRGSKTRNVSSCFHYCVLIVLTSMPERRCLCTPRAVATIISAADRHSPETGRVIKSLILNKIQYERFNIKSLILNNDNNSLSLTTPDIRLFNKLGCIYTGRDSSLGGGGGWIVIHFRSFKFILFYVSWNFPISYIVLKWYVYYYFIWYGFNQNRSR